MGIRRCTATARRSSPRQVGGAFAPHGAACRHPPAFARATLPCAVTIWDTAGQERFRTLTSSFYRGAHGVLLVYDVTQPETFEKLEHWLGEIDGFSADGGAHVAKLLIGNKSDLDERRAVAFADGEAWARTQGMLFLETSAKTNTSISQAFEEVIERILETPGLVTASLPAASAAEAPGTASAPSSGDVDIDGGGGGDAGPSGAAGCC